MRYMMVAALAAVSGLGALPGCGGDEGGGEQARTEAPPATTETQPSAEGGGPQLRLAADEGGALAFDKQKLTAKAGQVTLAMDNPSSVPHNVAIEGTGVDEKGPIVGQGDESKVSAELEPGTYEFYCSVAGHREAGMKGELVVK